MTAAMLVLGAGAVAFAQAGGRNAISADSAMAPSASSAAASGVIGNQAAAAMKGPVLKTAASDAAHVTGPSRSADATCASASKAPAGGVFSSAAMLASAGKGAEATVSAGSAHLAVNSGC